ncbi:hypothetical protein LINPERHAP2_LOCUS22246 [Linum perenne]
MRKTKRNKSTKEQTLRLAADGKDLISELPDEVLHWILCCINSPRQAAKTIALARRWRSLWGSYPVVEFHHTEYPRPPNCTSEASLVMEQFQRFGEATIDRFRRDGQLRMESLSVSLIGHERIILHSFDLEQLLILSTTRKAEEISIDVDAVGFDVQSGVELPIQILANSSCFFSRFIQFHTVDISVSNFPTFAFHREEVGCTEDPTTIDHLKLYTDLYMNRDLSALLEALFWVCRPKFFTVNHWDSNSKLFFQALLNVMSQHSCEPLNDHRCWQYQLKDVKIIVRDVEQILDKEGEVTVEEEELIGVSEDLATSFATPNRVCFMLTWH